MQTASQSNLNKTSATPFPEWRLRYVSNGFYFRLFLQYYTADSSFTIYRYTQEVSALRHIAQVNVLADVAHFAGVDRLQGLAQGVYDFNT